MDVERIEIVPLSEKLSEELDLARREALIKQEQIEPTKDELKNGWTKETLTKYLAEQVAGQSLSIDINSLHRKTARRTNIQNHKYNPLRWRS